MENIERTAMKKKRYYSIDIMKMICACLVVGIHAQFLTDISEPLGELVNGALGRMGVPFFSCVSGYFLIKAEKNGKSPLLHQVLSLLKYYVAFSVIYIIWDCINSSFSAMTIGETVSTIIKRFLCYGTYYHLWFFPCMILSLIVIHFAGKMRALKLLAVFSFVAYMFDALTYSWHGIGQTVIPGLDRLTAWFDFEYLRRFAGLTLPFAVLGLVILYTENYWTNRQHDGLLRAAWTISIIANITEIAIVLKYGIAEGTTVSFTLLPLIYFTFMLGLRYPLEKKAQAGKFCRNASVILYGLHPLFLEALPVFLPFPSHGTLIWGTAVILCVLLNYIGQILLREVKKTYDLKKRRTV